MAEAPPIRFARAEDGASIAYWEIGSGPTLLFVPFPEGQMQCRMMWQDELNRQFFNVIARHRRLVYYDPRNTGLSSRELSAERMTPAHFASDVEAVLDAVSTPSAGLYALTTGARTALEFATRSPERVDELVLAWPSVSTRLTAISLPGVSAMARLAERHWEVYTDLFAALVLGLDQPDVAQWWSRMIRASSSSADTYTSLRAVGAWDASHHLGELRCPTLVLQPEEEFGVIEAAREIAARIRGGELVTTHVERRGRGWIDAEARDALIAFLLRDERTAEYSSVPSRTTVGLSTILFTDVVSSTPLLSQLRDARMREVMRDHDAVCAAAITEHGGRVVKTIGDAFMAEFSVPSAAIEAAIAIQRSIRERFADSDVPIRLRIGINAGEPIVEDDDLHGASVVIAKRLESEADSGGILVSDVVRQAVAGKDFEFEDRGEVELKGFDQPVRAWAVRW